MEKLHRKMNISEDVYPKDPSMLLNIQSLLVIGSFANLKKEKKKRLNINK